MRRHPMRTIPPLLIICLATAAVAQPDLGERRQHILGEGQARFWRLRDPREVLTLDRVTDPRAAWARIELLARQDKSAAMEEAETLLKETIATLQREAEARASALREHDAAPGSYNSSDGRPTGWTAEADPFGSDPHYWEFDLLPPGARSIGLAGLWRFQPDPDDSGIKRGYARPDFNDRDWRTVYVPSKHGWKTQGYPDFNIFAWYRKTLRIPPTWKDQPLRLHLGHNRDNPHWVAINGQFLKPLDPDGSTSTYLDIPAKLLHSNEPNTIAIRMVNRAGTGGLLGPDLRLSLAASEPGLDRFRCGAGIARQTTHRTPNLPTIVTYSSALSPAAIVSTTQREIHLAGWAPRGYRAPRWCTFVSRGGVETIDLNETASIDPRTFDENWILLWDNHPSPQTPRPVMLTFEKRPAAILLAADGFGGRAVQLRFAGDGARMVMIRPFAAMFGAGLTQEQAIRCRLWSRALVKYPIGFLESVAPEDGGLSVRVRYEYLELKDDWGTTPIVLAPVPVRNDDSVKTALELTDLGCRSTGGYAANADASNYFAAVGKTDVAYTVPR